MTFTMLEKKRGSVSELLRGQMEAAGHNASGYRVTERPGAMCPLIVAAPDYTFAARRERYVPCGILLIPEWTQDALTGAPGFCAGLRGLYADRVVTYGMSPNASLSLSSVGEETCAFAVNREVTNVAGELIEQCELTVPSMSSPELSLCLAGTALLLGLLRAN
jgi:hypothetical protein